MTVLNIRLYDECHVETYNEILKYLTILIVLHVLLNMSKINMLMAFNGKLFNPAFISLAIYLLLGVLFYTLVVRKIIRFI